VKHTDLHPFEVFEDAEFLATLLVEAQKLKVLVVKELQRKFGPVSKQDEAREAVLNGSLDADVLPIGRDWENEVKVGVHADPSMNHLHIQVISVDRVLGGTQASETLQQFRDAVLCGFG
jgi:aprataxin